MHPISSFARRMGRVITRSYSTIKVDALTVKRLAEGKPKVPKDKLVFGANMSDHILEIDWTEKDGWSAPVVQPYHNFAIDPAASCLHYGLEAFEGLKAYYDVTGGVRLFRPELNMRRLAKSMDRLAMPVLDESGFLECIKKFVAVEKDWIPHGEGFSLYLRPTIIATWPYLGVNAAKSFKLYCIACPVGPYYPEGFKPVKLLAEVDNVRAWPGGVGAAKVGGNYAPTIKVQAQAAKQGYSQVLWLFGDKKEVTEVGTMNFFVYWVNEKGEKELITAPLDGTILEGVTRQSILDLARKWGDFKVSERKYTVADLVKASKENRLLEAFGSGTAAVVSPVKQVHYSGADYDIPLDPKDPSAGAGPLTKRFWDSLMRIQYGLEGDHPWTVKVPV